MDVKNIKRKTRPQKKARIVAIVASALTALFSIGVIISAINYPDAHSVDDIYEGDSLESIRKLDNNAYLVTSTVKDEEGNLKTKFRTILFDEVGQTYATGSYGIYNILKKIFAIYGTPDTWSEPLQVEVAKKNIGNGKSSLTLILK